MIYDADEFYPTPETLIAEMLAGIDYGDLEPEARETVKSFDGGEVGYTHTVANRKYFLFKPEKTNIQLEYSATPA